jgi:hypothetical protein
VLKDSLWKRTLGHVPEEQRNMELALLRSRATWLWGNTTVPQRKACFFSGLGRQPGLFIHEQLDALVDVLCEFQSAVAIDDEDSVADATVRLAKLIMPEGFFSVRKLPETWEDVLGDWVKGTAFSEILDGRRAVDVQRTQAFVQDGVVFRLVWAAEAVRVQALATEHPRAAELGDGPAFVLTYGVPTIPAALLCQWGFSSRVGALWVTRQLNASFKNNAGLRQWLRANDALLEDAEFWESEDHYLLWMQRAAAPSGEIYPRPWNRKTYEVSAEWSGQTPTPQTLTRVIPSTGLAATICAADLSPLGTAQLPFDPHAVALDASIDSSGQVAIDYFGSA